MKKYEFICENCNNINRKIKPPITNEKIKLCASCSQELITIKEQKLPYGISPDHRYIECDHRLTLRLPKWMLDQIDKERAQRVGRISRNLWILETINKFFTEQ